MRTLAAAKKSPAPAKKASPLATYVAANKRGTRLTGHIEQYLLKRDPEDRPTDVLHPSAMSHGDWCALENYHVMVGTVLEGKTVEQPGIRLASIFAEGHTIHHKWQNWLRNMGNLYGVWSCATCMLTWWDTSPQTCIGCHGVHVRYAEVPLISDPKYRISGHADGWVVGLGKPFVIELKSVGIGTIRVEDPKLLMANDNDLDKAWRAIRRPFPSHRRQGQMYLRLLHQMQDRGDIAADVEIPEEIVFLYELKANQDFKEFVMGYDPDSVDELLDLALDIDWAIKTKTPPECNVMAAGAATCKKCEPYRKAAL